jgi:hypothetical protein
MKLSKSTYFAFFFLFCFLAAFSANTFKNLNTTNSKIHLTHTKAISFSAKEDNAALDNDFLFEENENESENDFIAQVFLLPFFVSFFQYEVLQPTTTSATPVVEKLANPIYIAVCNFRI